MGADLDDARELTLERWGTRFASDATEQRFRAWHFARTMPQHRLFMANILASLVVWTVMFLVLGVLTLPELAGSLIPLYAFAASGAVALHRRDVRWWRRSWVPAAVSWALATLWLASQHSDFDRGGVALISGFLGAWMLAASTDGVLLAAPAALILVGGALCMRAQLWFASDLSLGALALEMTVLLSFFASGVLLAIGTDRAAHLAYRQERIIEAQKQTITRERARSEELLARELSHQVAERSRELGAVFARSDVTLDVRALRSGERFAERYKIIARLGAGGMGAVYEVERVTDGATLALKAVLGEVSGASAARFAREAEIGARIRHPNLIDIVDVGVSSGVPYLVMGLVRGGSLESQRAKFGDVPWALPIVRQIAEGLAALHDAGVVHRDLKPANVLLADGVAKISDFGISRFGSIDDASADPNAATMAATPKQSAELTGTGVVMGTPLYMAPEAARGGRQLDASADVFALGILAYELLTGRAPFAVPAFVLAMAAQPIPRPPAIDDPRVPAALRALVLECLNGDPSTRPRVHALRTALG